MNAGPQKTIAFAHLGCEKNRVDTEHMLGLLAQAGYGVSADEADANVVVVNTCSFIQEAREESVRTLVELAEQGKELIIVGCLAQHFQEELLESLPEAKAIVGTDSSRASWMKLQVFTTTTLASASSALTP